VYVAITGSGKARVIQFREDTRIPGTGKKKTHVIETLGNYEKMIAEDPDIIAKLKQQAKEITLERKQNRAPLSIQLPVKDIKHPSDLTPSFLFGHALVNQLWKSMTLDKFFTENCGKRNAEAVAQALYYLVAHRCSKPASINASVAEQNNYAGVKPLGSDLFYGVLDVLADQKEDIVKHLCSIFKKKTDRNGPEAYYDVTTYAFESTRWGELRMFGFSKEHKNNEVQVVMGLLLDNNGIPITYELFPGNTMDQNTLKKAVDNLKALYKLDKITIVADKGLNSGKNLEYLCSEEHDFVISYTLKRSPESFKMLILDQEDWQESIDKETQEVYYRSKVVSQNLEVKVALQPGEENTPKKRGRPKKYKIEQIPVNIHLTWSAKRAAKDRGDRERMIARLRKRLDKPCQLKALLKRGCNQYLQMELDTDTWSIDEEKITSAAKYDGYYAIITNNLELSTEKACTIYRDLWKIEESFRVLKTDLKARPVFVWTDKHVCGHFAMCYISLCLLRYAQYIFGQKNQEELPAARVMEAINKPLVLVQGEFPANVVTPTRVPQCYLDLAELLKLPPLKSNMTLTQFRKSTKLDLSINIG